MSALERFSDTVEGTGRTTTTIWKVRSLVHFYGQSFYSVIMGKSSKFRDPLCNAVEYDKLKDHEIALPRTPHRHCKTPFS